ncbi:sensor histidine kinase [Nocardioides pantholopis]|uniref:sensor histidine kinase n=1 Tax=Nocardioides pantholopis TaxID=2483798 RepID=UPI0013DDDCAC|nr:HAMP domain-containing sensor histidine kinase [Nocardioides pantholopis]
MSYERYPTDAWSWRGTLIVVLTSWFAPLAVTAWLAPSTRTWVGLTMVSQATVSASLLLAAVVTYFHYRLSGTAPLGWLSASLALIATQSIALTGLRADQPGALAEGTAWMLVTDLLLVLAALALVPVAGRTEVRVDPLAAGLLTGLGVTGLHLLLVTHAPRIDPAGVPVALVASALGAAGLGVAVLGSRITALPPWMTRRLSVAIGLATLNRIQTCLPSENAVASALMTVTGVVAAVLLVSTAVAALRWAISEHGRRFLRLGERVAQMEALERDSRARMHEVTNTIAGIASASTLIHRGPDLPVVHRHRLEEMVEHETARLARLLAGKGGGNVVHPVGSAGAAQAPAEVVDLDRLLEPLVVAQEVVGNPVRWEPAGLCALGRPDEVAEAVSILLDNARKHGGGSSTCLETRRVGAAVEVVVADSGPGIHPEVAARLFDWAQRGPRSHGQGIGLHRARRLLAASGSRLRLERTAHGTTFVITLPVADRVAS